MKSDTIIVDVQGFRDSQNQFIIKELAILSPEHTQAFLIKPPYSYNSLSNEEKRQVRWIEKNRGIFWSEGFVDYREFKRIIIPYLNDKKILCKGLEKTKWIKELCDNCKIIDIGERGCPNFLTLFRDFENVINSLACVYHSKQCALKNVICIKKWMDENNIHAYSLFTQSLYNN